METFKKNGINLFNLGIGAGLTVGPEEGRREEALVHQRRERDDADHVVRVKGQTAERLTAHLLCEEK